MKKWEEMPPNKADSLFTSFKHICLTSLPEGIPKYVGFFVENMHDMDNNA